MAVRSSYGRIHRSIRAVPKGGTNLLLDTPSSFVAQLASCSSRSTREGSQRHVLRLSITRVPACHSVPVVREPFRFHFGCRGSLFVAFTNGILSD